MFGKKSILLGIVLAVVMLAGATGCTAADLESIQGIIKDVDSVSGNVTVMLSDGTTRTFNFNDVTLETIREALGDLNLECGDNVTICENHQHQVQKMQLHRCEVVGTIQSIGADNATVTIDTNKDGEITLNITANTTIRVQGNAEAALSDLEIGEKVSVKYDVETMDALRINVNTGWEWGKQEMNQHQEMNQNQEHEQEQNKNQEHGPEKNQNQQYEQESNGLSKQQRQGSSVNQPALSADFTGQQV